ncbi:hypothetical protein BJ138DRAFT_1181182, partial [Hygrophoropsis aurantiaca]
MFQNLPPEILCKIIIQLPIKSIILLRQVSKLLCQVTYDRSIWVHAYRTSSLICPEGPLECQTAQMLESILVRSTRLKPNWPPNLHTKPVRTRVLSFQEEHANFQVSLLCERWLLVMNSHKQIVCYDLDATATRVAATMPTQTGPEEMPCSTLYDVPDESTSIMYIQCDSIITSCTRERCGEGRSNHQPLAFLVVVLRKDWASDPHMRIIYKIDIADDVFPTLSQLHQHEMRLIDRSPRMVLSPRLLALYDPLKSLQEVIMMDAETRQLYKFPENERELIQTYGVDYFFPFFTIVLTSTHVLLFRPFKKRCPYSFEGTRIEAYPVPSLGSSESSLAHMRRSESQFTPAKIQLQLSHVTTHTGTLLFKGELTNLIDNLIPTLSPLRDLAFNHTTGIASMVLTSVTTYGYISVLHLQLHPPSSPLPQGAAVASASNSIGTITLEPSNNRMQIGGTLILPPAFNGHTRGGAFYSITDTASREEEKTDMHTLALEIDDEEDPAYTWTSQ